MGPEATIAERGKAELRAVLADAGAVRNQINEQWFLTRSICRLNVSDVSAIQPNQKQPCNAEP
jgi:hypothetical protein